MGRADFFHPRLGRRLAQQCSFSVLFLGGIAPAIAQSSAPVAQAERDPKAEAAEFLRRGVDDYKKRDFEGARANFARAWALARHPAIAANLADVETRLGRWREAAEHWSFYLKNAPPERDRSDGEAGLLECRKHVAQLEVSAEAKAIVSVDGEVLGDAPLPAEIWLNPGRHTVEARFPGGSVVSQQVALSAGDAKRVSLARAAETNTPTAPGSALAPHSASTHPTAVSRQEQASASARTPVLIGEALLTVAAAGVGVGYGLKAQSDSSDAKSLSRRVTSQVVASGQEVLLRNESACASALSEVAADCAALRSKVESARSARSTATVAFIAAGVLGAGTLATYLLWPRPKSSSTSIVVVPWHSAGTSWVLVEGSF